MKTSQKFLAACAVVLTAIFLTAGTALASPVVQRITIQFNTLDSGKAPLSAVSVFVQNSNGVVVARYDDFAKGALAPNSTSPEFGILITHGPLTMDDLSAFKVTVQMQGRPGKTDTWRFKSAVALHLANGTVITRQSGLCELTSHSGGAAGVARDFHL